MTIPYIRNQVLKRGVTKFAIVPIASNVKPKQTWLKYVNMKLLSRGDHPTQHHNTNHMTQYKVILRELTWIWSAPLFTHLHAATSTPLLGILHRMNFRLMGDEACEWQPPLVSWSLTLDGIKTKSNLVNMESVARHTLICVCATTQKKNMEAIKTLLSLCFHQRLQTLDGNLPLLRSKCHSWSVQDQYHLWRSCSNSCGTGLGRSYYTEGAPF